MHQFSRKYVVTGVRILFPHAHTTLIQCLDRFDSAARGASVPVLMKGYAFRS